MIWRILHWGFGWDFVSFFEWYSFGGVGLPKVKRVCYLNGHPCIRHSYRTYFLQNDGKVCKGQDRISGSVGEYEPLTFQLPELKAATSEQSGEL